MSIDNYHRKLILLEIVAKSIRDSIENNLCWVPANEPIRPALEHYYESLRVALQRVEDARGDVLTSNFSEALYRAGRAA